MVMATARTLARRRMGARETTPPATPGMHHDPFHNQHEHGSSSLPMIRRRWAASSSFVLAAARLRALQLDPSSTVT
jgi:hypothetical protein